MKNVEMNRIGDNGLAHASWCEKKEGYIHLITSERNQTISTISISSRYFPFSKHNCRSAPVNPLGHVIIETFDSCSEMLIQECYSSRCMFPKTCWDMFTWQIVTITQWQEGCIFYISKDLGQAVQRSKKVKREGRILGRGEGVQRLESEFPKGRILD